MRLLRPLGALLALASILFGVPLLLLAVANPGYILTVDWSAALLSGADSRLILALLGLVGWLAWAVLAIGVLSEAVSVLSRQRVHLRVPGPAWLRAGIGTLVVTALAAPGMASADDAVTAPQPAATESATEESAASAPTSAGGTMPVYVVQAGDELWAVAEAQLGAGERWRDIVELNEDVGPTTRLTPGQRLRMPEQPTEVVSDSLVVEKGDSLWSLADEHLGDPRRWPELHELNRDQIADPDVIDVGWELRLPTLSSSNPPSAPPTADASAGAADTAHNAGPQGGEPPASEPTAAATPSSALPALPQQPGPAEVRLPASEQRAAALAPDSFDIGPLVGPIGAALAAAVVGGVAARRRSQLLARRLGERLVPLASDLSRHWGALARRADSPGRTPQPDDGGPIIVLGWRADDSAVTHDLEATGLTLVTGDAAQGVLGAAIACLAYESPTSVVVVGDSAWAAALDEPGVSAEPDISAGVSHLQRLCAARRLALGRHSLAALRTNPETADAMEPVVFVFTDVMTRHDLAVVTDALDMGPTGVSILAAASSPCPPGATVVDVTATQGLLGTERFEPQMLTEPARHAILGLLEATAVPPMPAPWWRQADPLPAQITALPARPTSPPEDHTMTTRISSRAHPTLLLLGDVDLLGAAGSRPSRAVGQCLEYCAWLLAHPGARPSAMVRELMVADTTRRSNMSRLRSWLGEDGAGVRYLPDAYSGRISLDARVTSDWEEFQVLLSGGVNVASTGALREALSMVRGEPLGSMSFQWLWAETLRADMVAMIVDAACVLADRSLDQADPQAALWAIEQGWLAAPADDQLAVRRIDALASLGRVDDLNHAVMSLTRALRADSRDLPTDLARRVQAATQSPRRAMA